MTPTVRAQAPQAVPPKYPPTNQVAVSDDYHGTTIADPYRWLEDLNSDGTRAWIQAQNKVTFEYLQSLPAREALRRRITELWDYPKVGIPWREGGRIWNFRNAGLQRQAVLYSRAGVEAPAAMIIDPNALSPDGSISLAQAAPSPDGRLLAYSLSEGGEDWQTVYVRDLSTGKDAAGDSVRWMRFSGISWTNDGKGFFYSRFPAPPEGKRLEAALGIHSLYYHEVGTDQSADRLIFERRGMPNWFVNGMVSEDGHYLFIVFSHGTDPKNRLYYIDLGDPKRPNVGAPVTPIAETDDAAYQPAGNVGTTVYLMTDLDAPRRRIVSVDLARPDRSQWQTIVPESANAIESYTMTGGAIALQYLADVQSQLRLFGLDGQDLGTVALPGIGTVSGMSGRNDSPELFYGFTSPLYPSTVFLHRRGGAASTPFEPAKPVFDPTGYETKQFFAVSKDGTHVPYFVTARKNLALNGRHPTLLYAYGGFSVSVTPAYRSDVPAWLERGGVYVTASLRGGGEYGEEWHQAGLLEKKQNVFDDFIAVAEDLIRRGLTSPSKLAIHGGSNGGLLVGAVMNQRPDLFAAALPAVGVMDMLRYHRFTGGAAWVVEYGASSDPKMFPLLIRYSPLHNLKPGTCYPATLVTTADHDDRVVPSHSFKYMAALQAAQGCARPTLIRIETQASHGYRPTDKRIAELADEWAFVSAQTDAVPARP
ncbi:MAG: S9 family peptidase [Gemmatimonadetes bacterium]|nr:S9 family peptidase [Gemmatimonadota bacterium]